MTRIAYSLQYPTTVAWKHNMFTFVNQFIWCFQWGPDQEFKVDDSPISEPLWVVSSWSGDPRADREIPYSSSEYEQYFSNT